MPPDLPEELDHYDSQTLSEFRETLANKGIPVVPTLPNLALPLNGIYVSPETKNKFYEYSNGQIDGCRYEQFVTSYYQDLAITAKFYAAVFVIELPTPTVPLYINSRTTLTLNSILNFDSVPVLNGVQKVALEGDFSEFFKVYSRSDKALDAFTTIVPNLMVDMLSKGSSYDVEFAGRYVYFYRIYGPSSSVVMGQRTYSIGFSADDYIAMREFGQKYGEKFVRAARPSTAAVEADARPLWQLVNENQAANNRAQYRWLAGMITYLFILILAWFIVLPLSFAWFGFRYHQWKSRKNRLLQNWTRKASEEKQVS